MKLTPKQTLKTKLTPTLRSWMPILKSSTLELEETLGDFTKENPFVEVRSNICQNMGGAPKPKPYQKERSKNYVSDKIEQFSVYEKSLYEVLESQILPPLFPTPLSQEIALKIIENLSEEGYFEGDIDEISRDLGVESSAVEQIRKRFSKIEPPGIAARDAKESMIFQLDDFDLSDSEYDLAFEIINNLDNHKAHAAHPHYKRTMSVIYKIRRRLPPGIDFFPKDTQILPDMFISYTDVGFEVSLNDSCYPDIIINEHALRSQNTLIRDKVREARVIIDALNMRKATLKKIGLMILEYQYDFFAGGDIKPLKLNDIAKELGHSSSTISRAVANKYLECDRGIYPFKAFFSTAISEDTSNSSIKDFVLECVKNEDRHNPLSDVKILDLVKEKFGIEKMVRRTITKYRQQLNIESSSERKKLYEMEL